MVLSGYRSEPIQDQLDTNPFPWSFSHDRPLELARTVSVLARTHSNPVTARTASGMPLAVLNDYTMRSMATCRCTVLLPCMLCMHVATQCMSAV